MGLYYPTCSSSIAVTLAIQNFNIVTSLTSCNYRVLGSNNLQISFLGQNFISGDLVTISNLQGTLLPSPISWIYNALISSFQIPINLTYLANSSSINFSLAYTNPTFSTTNAPIISLYRNAVQYGSGSVSLCTINEPYIKSSVLSISSINTFQNSTYLTEMGLSLTDYQVNDYIMIRFMQAMQYTSDNTTITTSDQESTSQLYSARTNNQNLSVTINAISASYTIVNSSSIKLIINSSSLLSLIKSSSSLSMSLSNLSNPIS